MRLNFLHVAAGLTATLHGYIGATLLSALPLTPVQLAAAIAALLVSCLLVPAPLLLQARRLPPALADAIGWAGYLAMGLFSVLLVFCFLRDALLLPVVLFELFVPGRTLFGEPALGLDALRQSSALAVLALTAATVLVGLLNARRTAAVRRVDLVIPQLPEPLRGLRIVQLSDLHVGPTIKRGYVEAIVRRANALDADLVAITGDVVDGSVERLREHVAPLARLRSRHGSYAVTGNHEYYSGAADWIREWRRLGLRVLVDESALIEHDGGRLLVGGVVDYSASGDEDERRRGAMRAAAASRPVDLRLLLAHQPRHAAAAAAAGFDVQLSGHTHGGQYWPWNFFVPLQQPYVAGVARLDRLLIYVSRGTGYWGPPLRFGAPSEITLLRLVSAPPHPGG